MRRTKELGDEGEDLVVRYLQRRKYRILDRQWRCHFGELDIVARSPEGYLCFVEVKRRGPGSIGLPREAVDSRKQERLRRAARLYLGFYGLDVRARFDVAEVYEKPNGALRVEYLENAFE